MPATFSSTDLPAVAGALPSWPAALPGFAAAPALAHRPGRRRRLVLVHDGRDAAVAPGDGTGATLRARLAARPGGYCYLRAEPADGELGWTSPIFFRPRRVTP